MHDELLYGRRVLQAGAQGYSMKDAEADLVLQAVQRVLRGGIYVSEALNDRILSPYQRAGSCVAEGGSALNRLSDRQREVFELTGEGLRRLPRRSR